MNEKPVGMNHSSKAMGSNAIWDYLLVRGALLVLVYYFAASAGIELTREAGNVAALWPANAIVIAVLLRTAIAHWFFYLMCFALANVMANLSFGDNLPMALGFVACNGLEIMVAVALVRRWCPVELLLANARQIPQMAFLMGGFAPALGALGRSGID